MQVEQIFELKQKLQQFKQTGYSQSYNILQELKQANLTTDQLKQTKITQTVKTLSDLKKPEDLADDLQIKQFNDMVNISQNLIKIWKSLFSNKKQGSQSSLPVLNKQKSLQRQNSTSGNNQVVEVKAQIPKNLDLKQCKLKSSIAYREIPLQKLFGAILAQLPDQVNQQQKQQQQNDDDLDFLDKTDDFGDETIAFAMDFAQQTEKILFNMVESNAQKKKITSLIERNYKIEMQDIVKQLLKNHELRQKILNNKVEPIQLASKETEIFLTELEKQEKKKIEEEEEKKNDQHFWAKKKKEFMEKHASAGERCRFCKKETAYMYDERQTRAADEPMTRFMRCSECDKQWRD